MRSFTSVRPLVLLVAVALLASGAAAGDDSSFEALYLSATGWVAPGETYPFTMDYAVEPLVDGATLSVILPEHAVFVDASLPPDGGDGSAGNPLLWNLAAGSSGRIIVRSRAFDLSEEPTMVWRDLSAEATFETTLGGNLLQSITSRTLGPKCTTHRTARYGVRPFPLVMVEYQDISHCTGAGTPFPECTGDHTGDALDHAVNSRTSGSSLWQLYQDMSFGQLEPVGEVRPEPGTLDETWLDTEGYPYKWSQLEPSGTCAGTTFAPEEGNPGSPDDNPAFAAIDANRVRGGWYVLPGNQGYYGSDASGHGLIGFVSGGLLLNIDDGCGPTGKIAYDAAAIADPDLDYNLFDTDRDGLVDFLNVAFAGDGGNGNASATGINNVWPHKSDLQFYFIDDHGRRGYVSNDQLRNHVEEPMFWTDESRGEMTTTDTGIPVWVRVGPYNVNPESAIEAISVVAHEYGHSLGLPDFYSLGSRETFGSWELMGSDHAQFMTLFSRQDLGWIVPLPAEDGVYTLRESKIDTGEITWLTPDGLPYTLTGPGIHNADALKVDLPKVLVIEEVPSGERAWHSGSGNEFGCAPEAGHNLDVFLPDLANFGDASSIELSFQSLYEIEWDWDFAFLLASTDGETWQALPSLEGTTLDGYNPNGWECYDRYGHGTTGVSRLDPGERNSLTNPDRHTVTYREAEWIEDRYDLTQFGGQSLILRFTYFTDPAVSKRGWFIDDLAITADGSTVYASDFEGSEGERLFPSGWAHVSTSTGVDTDHAYYVELRDRVGFDFDGRGQSERGAPTWQPGVAVLYTDENHGYGNFGVDNPPAQTVVDSVPAPGSDTPNLDDAAFVPEGARDVFNGCTHVDNYDNENGEHPEGLWKLPDGVRMTVTGLAGLSPDGTATGDASADLIVDVDPDCSYLEEPPLLSFGAGHEDPDPDGSFELIWQRPEGAVGPDLLQEATVLATLFADDAESGMGMWVVDSFADQCETLPSDFVEWQPSTGKFNSPALSFFTVAGETAYGGDCADFHSTMTLASGLPVPAEGTTVLSFWDSIGGELDDQGFVDVSTDGGATWTSVYQTAGPVFADQAPDFLAEPLHYREVDLTGFAGSTVLLRYHYRVGASNYLLYAPIGWWVDDVRVETADWYDLAEVEGTSHTRSGLDDGTYHYRVRTRFPGSPVLVDSPWSNVVSTEVVLSGSCGEIDDADPAVEYSGGWHRRTDGGTHGGYHRRMGGNGNGNGSAPAARVVFESEEITYLYVMSDRGGTADVYIDGDLRETLSYGPGQSGPENPTFGHVRTYSDLGPGSHELVIEHRSGAVYVDGFAFGCSGSGADPSAAASHSETEVGQASASEGPVIERTVSIGSLDESVSVVVEGSAVPLTVSLLGPAGELLATGESLLGGAASGTDAQTAVPGNYTVQVLNVLGAFQTLEVSIARTVRNP